MKKRGVNVVGSDNKAYFIPHDSLEPNQQQELERIHYRIWSESDIPLVVDHAPTITPNHLARQHSSSQKTLRSWQTTIGASSLERSA